MLVISWKMSRRRLSPSVIWGVTRSVTPMSWRSTLTEVERPESSGVLTVVGVCTRLLMIGMLLPIRISASSLSEVRMCGAEMMLVPASCAAARMMPWISEPLEVALPSASTSKVRRKKFDEERQGRSAGAARRAARSPDRARRRAVRDLRDRDVRVAVDQPEQPVEAELGPVGDVDLHDQRLDQHLGALDVELLDHARDRRVALLAGLDHERVGGRVGRHRIPSARPDTTVRSACAPAPAAWERPPGWLPSPPPPSCAGRGDLPADQGGQRLGQLLGVGELEVVDVDPAAARHRHVELAHQLAHVVELGARGQHDQRVGAAVRDDAHAPARGVGGGAPGRRPEPGRAGARRAAPAPCWWPPRPRRRRSARPARRARWRRRTRPSAPRALPCRSRRRSPPGSRAGAGCSRRTR